MAVKTARKPASVQSRGRPRPGDHCAGARARRGGAGGEDLVDVGGAVHQFGAACAGRAEVVEQQLEQRLLGVAVAETGGARVAVARGQRHGARVVLAGDGAEDLEDVVGVRVLGVAHALGVGLDRHDPLAQGLLLLEGVDGVAVALRHLLAVDAGQQGRVGGEAVGGQGEDLRLELAVEALRHVAGEFQVLHLVLADGHQLGVDGEDVRGLQDRIGEQADVGGDALGELVLVADRFFHQRHRADAGEQPGQLGDLGHGLLQVDAGLRRVQAEGQVVDDDLADAGAQGGRVARRGQRVVGRHEHVQFVALRLQVEELADRAGVVAEVELAGGLDAGEDAGHERRASRGLSGGT